MVPDRTLAADHWAALALAAVEVPDLHVAAGVGHADAGASRVIPELVRGARSCWHANPVADFGAEVGVGFVRRRFWTQCTFAGAAFGIIILVFIASSSSARVANARATLLIPVLLVVADVILLVALALAVLGVPLEASVAHARRASAFAACSVKVLVHIAAASARCTIAITSVRVVDVVCSLGVQSSAVQRSSNAATSARVPEPVSRLYMRIPKSSFKASIV